MNRRRKVFDKHLSGLVLGDTELADVKKKLGDPARTLTEERVTVLEYDDPAESSIAQWKKVQFIFFDGVLLNVSYSEAATPLSRAALHKLLGQPDDSPEEEGEDDEGASDIFEVEVDEDPMLSFVAHYTDDENVEALSLCADMSVDDEDEDDDADGEYDEHDEGGGAGAVGEDDDDAKESHTH